MCLAVPGKITSIHAVDDLVRLAQVDFEGLKQEVNLTYLPEANVGDFVIVHVGFAIARLDERAAQRTLTELKRLEGV